MALKPSQITRRNFVQRAGLLVSALGVGAGVQSGLLDAIVKKATRKWGNEALAQANGVQAFSVHIMFRAGWQNNSMFPNKGEATDAARAADLNIYTSTANIATYAMPNKNAAANPAYFSKIFPNEGADAIGQYLSSASNVNAVGLAYTDVIKQTSFNHTANFPVNAPTTSAPAPAVFHAARGPSCPVPGIEWNNGVSTTSQRGNMPALAVVKDSASLQSLFKDLPMYFTKDELKLIAGEFDQNGALTKAGSIDDFDKVFLAKNVPGSADVAQISLGGRNQAQLSVLQAITNKFNTITANGTGGNFVIGGTNALTTTLGSTNLGVALANAAAVFSAGVTNTFTISIDGQDGHGDISAMDDSTVKWAQYNRYVGNALTGFLKSMDQLTSPLLDNNASKMSKSMLVTLTSEFSRTLTNNNKGDNGDGGRGALTMIGSKVQSGNFGNVSGQAASQGFDPSTGALTGTNMINESHIWKAQNLALGLSSSEINGYVPDTMAVAAKAMVR